MSIEMREYRSNVNLVYLPLQLLDEVFETTFASELGSLCVMYTVEQGKLSWVNSLRKDVRV